LLENGTDRTSKSVIGETAERLAERLVQQLPHGQDPACVKQRYAVEDLLKKPPPVRIDPKPPSISLPNRPSTKEMEDICQSLNANMIDFYYQKGGIYFLERSNYSVFDVVYGRGPESIMSAAAEDQISLQEKQLLFRWIHLPANNVRK
jgi:hypothetical protein